MDYLTYSKRLEYLKEMIEKGQICHTKCIERKFECCNKTARNMINSLRELGYDIKFCRKNKKYFLKNSNGNDFTA